MVRISRHIKLIAAIIFLAWPAAADNPTLMLDFSGHYDFALGGIPFGQMEMKMSQKPTHYNVSADIAMVGIAKIFVQHESHTISKGSGQNFYYSDTEYESTYQTRKKPKYVKWVKKNSATISEIIRPPDNRASRPAVENDKKSSAYDPLLFALALRVEMAQAIKHDSKTITMSYYDGRRLARVYCSLNGKTTIRISGREYPVYSVTAHRTPLGGFTKKELSHMKNDPYATIYFSEDTLIPVRLEVPIIFGIASATLKM
jgi:ribosomal protein L24E